MFRPYPNGMRIGDLLPQDAFTRLKENKPIVDNVRKVVSPVPVAPEQPTVNLTKLKKEIDRNGFVLMNRGLQVLYEQLYGRKFKTIANFTTGEFKQTRWNIKDLDKALRTYGLTRGREMDKVIMLDQ